MRNAYLKEARTLWAGSRLFYGKLRVVARALGTTPEEEVRTGLSQISSVSSDLHQSRNLWFGRCGSRKGNGGPARIIGEKKNEDGLLNNRASRDVTLSG